MADLRIPLGQIKVGSRFRKDMGDLIGLSKSMDTIGLLHSVVIDKERNLIAGVRRLEAARLLGWDDIPCRVVSDLEEALKIVAERDENNCREPFRPSEAVALGKALEALEKPKAKERQKASGPASAVKRKQHGSEKISEPSTAADREANQTRAKVGKAVGVSGPTYSRMKSVIEAAEQDPDRFGHVAEEMDRTGNVSGAFREMQAIKRDPLSAVKEQPQNGAAQKPSKAIQFAHDAINCLMRIPKNDPQRKRGFQIVADFIKANKD